MNKKYLCGTDYYHEFKAGCADLHESVEELKNSGKCWGQCGIVEVTFDESGNEVSHKWIIEQDYTR